MSFNMNKHFIRLSVLSVTLLFISSLPTSSVFTCPCFHGIQHILYEARLVEGSIYLLFSLHIDANVPFGKRDNRTICSAQ